MPNSTPSSPSTTAVTDVVSVIASFWNKDHSIENDWIGGKPLGYHSELSGQFFTTAKKIYD